MAGSVKFRRSSIRAPLYREVLYVDDRSVQKAKGINISEGGILLCDLPHVPDIKLIHLMIELPSYPDFYALSADEQIGLHKQDLNSSIFRARARIVRSFEGLSEIEKVFIQNIGCQFVDVDAEFKTIIRSYLTLLLKNTVYILGLFENLKRNSESSEQIRSLAKTMGYKSDEKLSVLRSKILHDYSSLENT